MDIFKNFLILFPELKTKVLETVPAGVSRILIRTNDKIYIFEYISDTNFCLMTIDYFAEH